MFQFKLLTMLTCLIFLCVACKATQISNTEVQKPTLPPLKDILIAEEFGHGSGIHWLSVIFTDKGGYDFTYGSEGWYWSNKGQYKFVDSRIDLKPTSCGFAQEKDPGCQNTFTAGNCSLVEKLNDLEYLYAIKCKFNRKFRIFTSYSESRDELNLDVKKHKLPIGTERVYQGTKVLTTGNTIGTVVDTVFLREGPGTQFKKIDYIVNAYDGPRLPSVPASKKVVVHARSLEKSKVKDWENYWLVVSIDDSHHAWAFGEFIKY